MGWFYWLASDEQWDGVPPTKLKESRANRMPQSASLAVGYNVPHLKCFSANAPDMRSKEEELEALETTGLSVSLQYLVKSRKRLFWEA